MSEDDGSVTYTRELTYVFEQILSIAVTLLWIMVAAETLRKRPPVSSFSHHASKTWRAKKLRLLSISERSLHKAK